MGRLGTTYLGRFIQYLVDSRIVEGVLVKSTSFGARATFPAFLPISPVESLSAKKTRARLLGRVLR